ncbi:hypothetical protein M378DRAFT_15560 [Amanita muscaria Koide BX008]|uniref:Uncharacterized protein n=1 Tax=Amanita muscaria (strain Koide BX008) TaxID=946122 RepID=A0A0C2SWG5_AMAMK|nr:hypothetical protein M378DRAFT_15560 [Amanita muscaria Koide BX008]
MLFGYASSRANSDAELANAENRAMSGTELIISDTFEELSRMLKEACKRLELDLIPKPAGFISTISDEHDIFKEDIGIGSCRLAMVQAPGIKHKIKGGNNSGLHVELIKEYVRKPSQTTPSRLRVSASKQDTLILKVDGCDAVCFVDLLRDSGGFTERGNEYLKIGTLNGSWTQHWLCQPPR